MMQSACSHILFFFNDTATTEIYTLSLHDALPISLQSPRHPRLHSRLWRSQRALRALFPLDRKSTRLNSSHSQISYAVFCLKKKISTPNEPSRVRTLSSPTVPPTRHGRCSHTIRSD